MQIDLAQWFMFHINDEWRLRYSNSYQSYSITCHIYFVRPVINIKNYDLMPKDCYEFVYKKKM